MLQWYEELRGSNSRGWHFEPISYSEILAYKTLHELEMDGIDVSLLIVLDGLWMKTQPKPKTKGKP